MKWLLFFIVFFSSCIEQQDEFKKILVGQKNYWIYYRFPNEQLNKNSFRVFACTKFYLNNTFEGYHVNGEVLEKDFYLDKQKIDKNWSYNKSDSAFNIESLRFKVIQYQRDTITLINEDRIIQKLVRLKVK